jgi:hypothetical protein
MSSLILNQMPSLTILLLGLTIPQQTVRRIVNNLSLLWWHTESPTVQEAAERPEVAIICAKAMVQCRAFIPK